MLFRGSHFTSNGKSLSKQVNINSITMETTDYTIETNYNGNELKVTGTYDGETFKAETIEPLHEGGQIIIPSFADLEKHILKNKFAQLKNI